MKENFFKINKEKQTKIINACINEFGVKGYEKSSIDRIINSAGISKGGLYEYISSKDELFLYTIEYAYKELYNYILLKVKPEGLSRDFLEKFREVSAIAIDFYIDHPDYIRLISSCNRLKDNKLEIKIRKIFLDQFLKIFSDIDDSNLKYSRERLLDLLIWLLVKTREEFLEAQKKNSDIKNLKKTYSENWEFYLSVFKTGIYK